MKNGIIDIDNNGLESHRTKMENVTSISTDGSNMSANVKKQPLDGV